MNRVSNPETEQRRYPRVMAPVLCRVIVRNAKKRRIFNLSLGGVRIYSDERLEAGQELDLEFFLPRGFAVGARARVVWIKELPPGSPGIYDVGLEFVALSKKAKRELGSVLR